MKKLKSNLRDIVHRLISIEGDPHKIALGYALGIFLTTTPFVGLKVPIALGICQLFKWKKTAAIIGVFHVNTLTGPFYYGFSFLLGKVVMGYDCSFDVSSGFNVQTLLSFFTGSRDVFISLLMGGLILGIPLSFLAYKLILALLNKHAHAKAVTGLSTAKEKV